MKWPVTSNIMDRLMHTAPWVTAAIRPGHLCRINSRFWALLAHNWPYLTFSSCWRFIVYLAFKPFPLRLWEDAGFRAAVVGLFIFSSNFCQRKSSCRRRDFFYYYFDPFRNCGDVLVTNLHCNESLNTNLNDVHPTIRFVPEDLLIILWWKSISYNYEYCSAS